MELTEIGHGRDILRVAGFDLAEFALSISISNRDAVTGAQRIVLEEIVRRSGGELTGVPSAEPTAEERDQLGRVLTFVLDVVQGEFLDRPHPAKNRDHARLYALSRNRKQLKAVAGELNRAGYLTASTYGQWSTSSVTNLLRSPIVHAGTQPNRPTPREQS